jgi:tRNA(fMet)-specific endonuclease VapC
MKYLLDTNICIYIIKKKPPQILKTISKTDFDDIGISSITLGELEYGVEKSSNSERNRIALIEFLSMVEIHSFDDRAAREYGILRADLERKGKTIGPFDMLIAAHARSLGIILVTNNEKEFRRVSDLKVENWV